VSRSLAEGNTVCSNAEPAQLNTSTTTAVEAGKTRWYSFPGEAGKAYEVSDCGGADFDTELRYGASCEELSNHDGGCNGYMQERLIVQGEGKLVYFGWKASGSSTASGSVTWAVTEAPADNRLCAYAEYVSVGDSASASFRYGVRRWYRFTAQAGKSYEIVGAGGNGSNSAQLSVLSGTCDSANTLASGSSSLLFQPEQTAVYYIRCGGSSSSDYVWSWQVREVTDNRICANATAVAENTQAGNTHTGGNALWRAFTASAAGQYDVTAPAGQQLKVWTGCGESSAVAASDGSKDYTITVHRAAANASSDAALSNLTERGQLVACVQRRRYELRR
jgi:hypothetical protein